MVDVSESVQKVLDDLRSRLGEARFKKLYGAEMIAYAGCVARLLDAQRRIEAEGLVVPDSRNQPVVHLCLAIEKSCQDELRKWGNKFMPR